MHETVRIESCCLDDRCVKDQGTGESQMCGLCPCPFRSSLTFWKTVVGPWAGPEMRMKESLVEETGAWTSRGGRRRRKGEWAPALVRGGES